MRLWDCNWQVVTCMIWPLKGSKEVSPANCLKMRQILTNLHHIESLHLEQLPGSKPSTIDNKVKLSLDTNSWLFMRIFSIWMLVWLLLILHMISHLKTFQALHFALGHPTTCTKSNTLQITFLRLALIFLYVDPCWLVSILSIKIAFDDHHLQELSLTFLHKNFSQVCQVGLRVYLHSVEIFSCRR